MTNKTQNKQTNKIFDRKKMEKSILKKRYTVPANLSREEIRQLILSMSKLN